MGKVYKVNVSVADGNKVISELMQDHKYMIKLLYQLEQEIRSLSTLTQASVNLDKLLEIVDYVNQYPEICHHPVEERMFQLLKTCPLQESEAALIEKIIDEHLMLDALAELLEIKISEYLADSSRQASLLRTADMFVQQQLKHIECEQNQVFKLCKQYLQPSDWEVLVQVFQAVRHNDDDWQQYQTIREKIIQSHLMTA